MYIKKLAKEKDFHRDFMQSLKIKQRKADLDKAKRWYASHMRPKQTENDVIQARPPSMNRVTLDKRKIVQKPKDEAQYQNKYLDAIFENE